MEKNTNSNNIITAYRWVQPNHDESKFRAAVRFRGERILSKVVDSESGALRSLVAEMKRREIPMPDQWHTIKKEPAGVKEDFGPTEHPPMSFAEDGAAMLDNPEAYTECENTFGIEDLETEDKAPEAPEPPRNFGYTFPWNDMAAWVKTYNDACEYAFQLHYAETRDEDFSQDNNRRTRLCQTIDHYMEMQGFAGAYRQHPSGDKYIRYADCKDIAAPAPKRRGRTQVTKNINGNKEVVEHGEVIHRVKDGKKVSPKKSNAYTSGTDEQRKNIYKFASRLSNEEAEFIASSTGVSFSAAKKEKACIAHYWAGWLIGVKANHLSPHSRAEQGLAKYGYSLDFKEAGGKVIALLTDPNDNTALIFNVTDWRNLSRQSSKAA